MSDHLQILELPSMMEMVTFLPQGRRDLYQNEKNLGPPESPHENKGIFRSVMNMFDKAKFCKRELSMHIPRNKCVGRRRLRRALNNLSKWHVFINDEYLYQHGRE